jgi:Ras-related protein Rab-7A
MQYPEPPDIIAVIARQALAQEEAGDFSNDYPEPINIRSENDNNGCAC